VLHPSLIVSCKEDDDDDTATITTTAVITPDVSVTITGDGTISGSHTFNASVPNFLHDPLVHYDYNTSGSEYKMIFSKTYSSGTRDYPTSFDTFDDFDILFMVNLLGTPRTGDVSLVTSTALKVDTVIYSPTGGIDLYAASASIAGSSVSINITASGATVGDHFTGTITSATLCQIDATLTLTDSCVTKKVITGGTFDVVRDSDG